MKKRIGLSVLLTLIMLSSAAQDNVEVAFLAKFKLANTSVRAIEVINKNTLWFAGSGGKYGRIINDRLEIDSISHEGKYPQFRSIGFNGTFLFLLSIENLKLYYLRFSFYNGMSFHILKSFFLVLYSQKIVI